MATAFRDSTPDHANIAQPDAGVSALPILTTKLYRPPAAPHLERCTRLTERLKRNRQRPLTLILAPAGYGKTMLASTWLESSDCASA